MNLKTFVDCMERIAPASYALPYDNVGLLIGPDHQEIKNVLVALDLSVDTASEAVRIGADLVLTHHPVMFQPVHRILPDDPDVAAIYILIRNGIGHFAAHTNLDAAPGGVNDCLCGEIGLCETTVVGSEGILRTGSLEKPHSLSELSRSLKGVLGKRICFIGDADRMVLKGTVCSGAGNGQYRTVFESGADFYLTGELKHSEAILYRNAGIGVIVAGHYETERVVLPSLISRLQEMCIDVQFNLTRSEVAPFSRQEEC